VPPTALLRAKPKILAFHRWLALFAGLFLISQGLTGTIIAFRYELNRALHPGAMTVAAQSQRAPLSVIIKAAQHALPGAKVNRVDYPRAPDDAFIARLSAKDGTASIATVDPSGHVTRAGSLWSWPVEAAYAVHESLMSGEAGQRGVGFIGLALLVLAISGLLYWWPSPGRFAKTLAQTARPQLVRGRATRELHRAAGVLFALYLVMLALIGLTMAWSPWTRPVLGAVFSFSAPRAKPPKEACTKLAPLDDAVAAAQARMPGQAIKSVRFQAKGRIVGVYFQSHVTYPPRSTDHVWINGCDGSIQSVDDKIRNGPGDKVFDWLLPIHSGEWLGLPGRLLSWSAALALVVMGISGYVLWVIRRMRRRPRSV
jgi:uncharacterized iron-regulated membrane protein